MSLFSPGIEGYLTISLAIDVDVHELQSQRAPVYHVSSASPFVPLQELWGSGARVSDVSADRLLGTSAVLICIIPAGFLCLSLLRHVGKSDIRHGTAQVRHGVHSEDRVNYDTDDFPRLL